MSRFFLFVGIILLVGIAALGFLVLRRARNMPQAPSSATGVSVSSSDGGAFPVDGGGGQALLTPFGTPVPTRPPEVVSREVFVRNFIERYGSYSTDAPYENYKRTQGMMSARLWAEAEKAMAKKTTVKEFVQVITRVQSVRVQEESSDRAIFVVSTTREEERGKREPTLTRKIVHVTLVKDGDAWKADRVEWR